MSVLKLSGLMCSVTIWTLWFDNMLLIIPESRYEVVLDYVVCSQALGIYRRIRYRIFIWLTPIRGQISVFSDGAK
jgi:hypothetical protein